MNKRTFIKLSSAMLATPIFSPLLNWTTKEKLKNWAGNLSYSTENLHQPTTIEQMRSTVKQLDKMKALGTRHCFNTIADSKHNLVSTELLNEGVIVDAKARTVTIDAGMRYGQLAPELHSKGFALHNLASLPHISIGGSCSTATHGSGDKNGNLATSVSAIEFISADGALHRLSRDKDGDTFRGAVVGLGAMGVLTKMTLDIQPTYNVRQYVYENMPMSQMSEHFDAITSSGYSVSLFTDWRKKIINEVWVKSRVGQGHAFDAKPTFYGAKRLTRNVHPIIALGAENCTEQLGIAGPWHERLPHFRMGFTPSSGKELQTEYFVPRKHAVEAIMAIQRLHEQVSPHLMISEIRTIAADNFWMSPCYKQASVALHFTWKQDWPAVSRLLPIIEKELAPFTPRPHWGKLFTLAPKQLQSRYEKLADFKKLAQTYDPKGKFRNDFLNINLYSA